MVVVVVVMMMVIGRWTCDQQVAGSTPGRHRVSGSDPAYSL